jgi:hypothetical protein
MEIEGVKRQLALALIKALGIEPLTVSVVKIEVMFDHYLAQVRLHEQFNEWQRLQTSHNQNDPNQKP